MLMQKIGFTLSMKTTDWIQSFKRKLAETNEDFYLICLITMVCDTLKMNSIKIYLNI